MVGFKLSNPLLHTNKTDQGTTPLPGSVYVDLHTRGITNTGTIDTSADCDTITATGYLGIYNDGGTINTGAGKDTITGISSGNGYGINNQPEGTIDTGAGNDTITAISSGDGLGIVNYATITTGDGNDTITCKSNGIGGRGISTTGFIGSGTGIIDTGAGNDTITSNSSDFGIGISDGGIINTGDGNDTIIGTISGTGSSGGFTNGIATGIVNDSSTIDTGDGNDTIIGNFIGTSPSTANGIANIGTINTGTGNDTIIGNAAGTSVDSATGILNLRGLIDTSAGDDILIGKSTSGIGIYNDNTINTGTGNDIVDALTGGFGGTGTIMLENGNDILKGFGSGFFDGGNGNKDKLLFGTGSYTVSDAVNIEGFYTVSNGTTDMFVKNFEFIGSANDPAAAFSLSSVIGETFMV